MSNRHTVVAYLGAYIQDDDGPPTGCLNPIGVQRSKPCQIINCAPRLRNQDNDAIIKVEIYIKPNEKYRLRVITFPRPLQSFKSELKLILPNTHWNPNISLGAFLPPTLKKRGVASARYTQLPSHVAFRSSCSLGPSRHARWAPLQTDPERNPV